MSARKTLSVPSLWMNLFLLWPYDSSSQFISATVPAGFPIPAEVRCPIRPRAVRMPIPFALLPIAGTYSIEAEQKDFQCFVQRNVARRVNENVRVDISVKVGEVS